MSRSTQEVSAITEIGLGRRDFLKVVGVGTAAALLGSKIKEARSKEATADYYGVAITNSPETVNPDAVETAKEENGYINTIGLGSEQAFAKPGGLWVGSDFDQAVIENSGGAIQQFNELNHGSYTGEGPEYTLNPEGGWTFYSLGKGKLECDDVKLRLKGKKGRNHFVAVRGRYTDSKQDEDKNNLIKATYYVPGANEWNTMQAGENGNIAFLDEGQLLQRVQTSHTEGTNCGAEGCSELILTVYDRNTGAYSILKQTQGRNEDASDGWQFVGSNWKKAALA